MSNLKNKNLAFFMTEGVSLDEWGRVGMFSREMETYNILAKHFNKIYVFTYGNESDLEYKKYLADNIEIIHKKNNVKNRLFVHLYAWFLPIINWRVIRRCDFFKTNQMQGAQSAIVAKLLNWRARLIVRTGFSLSFTAQQKNKKLFYYLIRVFEFLIYRLCNVAFVTSRKIRDDIIRRYKIDKNKIKIIPNYINTDKFKPEKNTDKFKNKIIFIGRVVVEKNLLNLITALKGIDLELDIIGSKTVYADLVIKRAKEEKVQINFLGNFKNNELPKILNKYNVFVLPSIYEGMPKTLLEAMSCGLACIGTDVPGINELIIDNETGLLSGTDADSLRENILKLIDNQELQKKLGANARKFICENYSLNSQIKKEIEAYEKVIKK